MEVENQEGQGPLWAVVPLMMMIVENSCGLNEERPTCSYDTSLS
jgi:hypothetical protein